MFKKQTGCLQNFKKWRELIHVFRLKTDGLKLKEGRLILGGFKKQRGT